MVGEHACTSRVAGLPLYDHKTSNHVRLLLVSVTTPVSRSRVVQPPSRPVLSRPSSCSVSTGACLQVVDADHGRASYSLLCWLSLRGRRRCPTPAPDHVDLPTRACTRLVPCRRARSAPSADDVTPEQSRFASSAFTMTRCGAPMARDPTGHPAAEHQADHERSHAGTYIGTLRNNCRPHLPAGYDVHPSPNPSASWHSASPPPGRTHSAATSRATRSTTTASTMQRVRCGCPRAPSRTRRGWSRRWL